MQKSTYNIKQIMTTHQTGGLSQGYKPQLPASAKDAGFHFVQDLLLLTRHLPLKKALVLLTTIPKGTLIFFYTQFIQCYIMLYSFSNFHTREEIIHWIISLILNIFLNCGFIESNRTHIITFHQKCRFPNLYLRLACLSNIMSALFPFK